MIERHVHPFRRASKGLSHNASVTTLAVMKRFATLLGIAIAVSALSVTPAQASALNGPPAGSSCHNNGETRYGGQIWETANGVHLELQKDGNMVLSWNDRVLWASGTRTAVRATIQGDGNLVEYNNTGGAVWASGTSGNAGALLCVQPDGNLVIYGGGWFPIWATNTH